MPESSAQSNTMSSQKKWILIMCVLLVLLAVLWSVDSSVFYLLLSGVVFSIFKIFQYRSPDKAASYYNDLSNEPDQVTGSSRSDYKKTKGESVLASLTPEKRKIILILVAGFTGFIFFFIIVGALIDIANSTIGNIEYQQKASDFYYNQQYDSSAFYYWLAIQNDPENAQLWFERGNTFLNVQNSDSALVMYRRSLDLMPGFEQAQYNIGYIYFNRKNYRAAIDETKKILDYNPDYVDATLLIGDSYYNQSQLDSALQWYEGAYKTGYRSAILCHLMAYIYDSKGETSVAIPLYREAIGQDSTITDIYVRLGELVPGEEGELFRTKAARLNAQQSQ